MPDYGTPENPYIIRIPGWDDFVKIHPRLKFWSDVAVAKKDWALFYKLRAEGRLDDYPDKEKLAEIQRRWDRVAAMKASPTPEIVRSIGKIMTYIDDTEDLLSTALVLGKILVKRAPWLAAKVGSKFIPILGWALLARDILEIGTFLWKLLPWGRRGKKHGWDIINPRSWRKRGRLKRVAKFMKHKPGMGALIEGLQAGVTVFGTGMQIGPAIGIAEDTIFGAVRAAGGKTVKVKFPGNPRDDPDQARVARGMHSAAAVMMQHHGMFQDVHMLALVAFALGLQVIQPTVNDESMIDRSDELTGYNVPHIVPWEPMTRLILEDHGIDPDRDEPHLYPGSPTDLSYSDLADYYVNAGKDTVDNYANMFPSGDMALFTSSTIREIIIGCFNCDLPADVYLEDDIYWAPSSEEAMLLETIETGIRPPIRDDYSPPVDAKDGCYIGIPRDEPPIRETGLKRGLQTPPGGLPYMEELELLATDYERAQEYNQRTKIGTTALKNMIECHFGTLMPFQDIPRELPW